MITLVGLVLATWGLSSLLAVERGPFALFEHLRRLSGVKLDAYSSEYASTELAKGLTCMWCNSVWCGFVFSLLSAIVGIVSWKDLFFLPFALSAGAILLEVIIERIRGEEASPPQY